MNQSIRATEPAKKIRLHRHTDCVIFDPENQQIILSSKNFLSCYDRDTLGFRHGFFLEKFAFLFDLQFQPCTIIYYCMIQNFKFMFYQMKTNHLQRLKFLIILKAL